MQLANAPYPSGLLQALNLADCVLLTGFGSDAIETLPSTTWRMF